MAQFTKKAIVEAFIRLLNKKPLEKITVKEIVDDCGINRNTFYYHFEDIHALLTFVIDAEVERVIAEHSDVESLEEGFIEAAKFALSNKRAVYHIYNSVSREELERYLNGIAGEVVERLVEKLDLDQTVSRDDKALIIHFYKCGLVGIVMSWVSEGMKADPELLIHSLSELLDGSVAAALNNGRERAKQKDQEA